ncbi:FadR/GntR family transcriptional regulator [Arthrobacter cupressi]|uniref:DNA-binding transcriptional regulator, FadR family n=1 Tax=Arthrobacter cupressi TaxID=1045773 RepID=A0A1G8WC84_9MICC|nr:FadR/GntR family transcriptional regulator [Arthrobacter cupressi]NYD76331.1 DNA-binding FadR family transcriptional regulator [Arthrobacter cupressi]SDJ75776.1 DNA-binding transcriptional regulator, FadR family [Arthrobacter cupressi]
MSNLLDSWTADQGPLVRVGAAEGVLAALRSAIESGKLPVGTKLESEAMLAQRFGVSRTMVREALRSLASLGLTATQTGKGTFVVADQAEQDLRLGRYSARQLMEARPHIEIPAAGLAAQRRSSEDLEGLREILDAMDAEEELSQWVVLNSEFHARIARASGNGVFATMQADIEDAMSKQSNTLNQVLDRRKESGAEHHAIFEAIERGSADEATLAMMLHLQGVEIAVETVTGKDTQDL